VHLRRHRDDELTNAEGDRGTGRLLCRDRGVEKRNETHAMLGAIDLAGAENAMMVFIGVSAQLCDDVKNYTTPIETMDAYYDNLKAGPWIGLVWWRFNDDWGAEGASAASTRPCATVPPTTPTASPASPPRATPSATPSSPPACACSTTSCTGSEGE